VTAVTNLQFGAKGAEEGGHDNAGRARGNAAACVRVVFKCL